MDPFDWYHLLAPLTLVAISSNLLVGFALKPEHRSPRLNKLSNVGYLGCLLGWLTMAFGISLKSMGWLIKISILGWLLWLPSLCLIAFCCLRRLAQNKDHFSPLAINITHVIAKVFKIILNLLKISLTLILQFLAKKPKYKMPESDELNSHDTMGGPHIFTKPPDNIFGEGNASPHHDPLSPWNSSR